jgi:integrase
MTLGSTDAAERCRFSCQAWERQSRAAPTTSSADPTAGPLDRSAVRSRFIRAQEKAGVRVRRFHDLRHTFGSLAIQQFALVAVKDMMDHSKLTTTERYLHSSAVPTTSRS